MHEKRFSGEAVDPSWEPAKEASLFSFATAEAASELGQMPCQMNLKTSASVRYNGGDGLYARGLVTGI